LREIVPGIRHHHEQYDGKGYPDVLKGEEIPLIARVISVCDTFDAMTSDRPYRKGLSPEIAREELRTHANTQFDPNVVRAFLAAYESGEIEPILEKVKRVAPASPSCSEKLNTVSGGKGLHESH
jgi:HD-GYP domain-containing protein (c-di-GMP phosphodiesterase class II)